MRKPIKDRIEQLSAKKEKQAARVSVQLEQLAGLENTIRTLTQETFTADAVREIDLRDELARATKKREACKRELETEQIKLDSYNERLDTEWNRLGTYRAAYQDACTTKTEQYEQMTAGLKKSAKEKLEQADQERERYNRIAAQAAKGIDPSGSPIAMSKEDSNRFANALRQEADRRYKELKDEADFLVERAGRLRGSIDQEQEKARLALEQQGGQEAVRLADAAIR